MNGFIWDQRKKRPAKNFYNMMFNLISIFFLLSSYVELTVVYPFFLLPAFFN